MLVDVEVDVKRLFSDVESVSQYRCLETGYKYWEPKSLAGDECFYSEMQALCPNYYRSYRWEYDKAAEYAGINDNCLEIGCGRGYFLRKLESKVSISRGIEFNHEAIQEKVCSSEIFLESLETHQYCDYDCIFSFQVLEHVIDPDSFLRSCFARLKKGGKLVLSTPNDQWHVHKNMEDPLNLPPHHMGCFDPDVFERLATLYNQKLVSIKLQPCEFPFPSLSQKSLDSFAYKAFCKLNSRLGNRILQSLGEPGHTLLAVFEKI